MPEAEALSCTCSGREAPTIADATFSLAQHPRERELGHRDPEALGDRDEPLDALEHVVAGASSPIIRPIRSLVAREPSGGAGAGPVLAGQRALRERRPDDLRDAVRRAERDHLALGVAPEQRVLRLRGDELRPAVLAAQVERRLDLRRRPLAEADVARLAGPHDLGRAPPSSPRAASARRSGGTGRGRRSRCAGGRATRRSASAPARARGPGSRRCRPSGSRASSRARTSRADATRARRRGTTRPRRARRRSPCR